jgi:hypothetical protein
VRLELGGIPEKTKNDNDSKEITQTWQYGKLRQGDWPRPPPLLAWKRAIAGSGLGRAF